LDLLGGYVLKRAPPGELENGLKANAEILSNVYGLESEECKGP